MNAGRGTKHRTPDLGDKDSPLSELSPSPSAPKDNEEEDYRSDGSRAGGPRPVAGKKRAKVSLGEWQLSTGVGC